MNIWRFLVLLFAVAMPGGSRLWANYELPDSLRVRLQATAGREVLVFANNIANEDLDAAMFAFGLAHEKAKQANDAALLFAVLRDEGIFWEDQNRLDSAAILFQKAFQVAESQGLAPESRTALNDLAIVSRKLERYRAARDYHSDALARAQKSGDEELVEFSWHGLGFLYEIVGDHAQALQFYRQSYRVAEKRGHQNGMMVTLGNLAEMFASTGQEREALEHAEKGLALALTARDTEQIAQLYFIQADVFEQFGRTAEAMPLFEKCVAWSQLARDWDTEAEAQLRLGQISEKNGDLTSARTHYQACLLRTEFLTANFVADAYLHLGELAKEAPEGSVFFKRSLAIARENHLPEHEIAATRALSSWYSRHGQAALALPMLERANALQDSLSAVLREKSSGKLAFRYDLEKNARDLEAMEIRANRMRMAWVLLAGLLAVGALAYLVRMRYKTNTELRQRNEAINAQNTRLEESNRYLTQFTYAVAHDLKEPLRGISSFTALLERRFGGQFEGDGLGYMQFVQQGVKRMHALINDLLAFSHISSQRPGSKRVDSKQVLDSVLSTLNKEIRERRGHVEYPDALPPVKMEPSHLGHIFQNIIHNGLKFNDNAEPHVSINAHVENGHVLFSIEDDGIGIEREHGKKVFELFQQLHKNKPYGGTGIGLTVVKNIVDKYNGYIWFEPASESGGTRFWVGLPMAN